MLISYPTASWRLSINDLSCLFCLGSQDASKIRTFRALLPKDSLCNTFWLHCSKVGNWTFGVTHFLLFVLFCFVCFVCFVLFVCLFCFVCFFVCLFVLFCVVLFFVLFVCLFVCIFIAQIKSPAVRLVINATASTGIIIIKNIYKIYIKY